MTWDVNDPRHLATATLILCGVEAGELSEAQACRLLDVDVVLLRELRRCAIAGAREAWRLWREAHPALAARLEKPTDGPR